MINTVRGKIPLKNLGNTLMHEHILYDSRKAEDIDITKYNKKEILAHMIPILNKLKESGCITLVDSTPEGTGRAVHILRDLSIKTGLNIITNVGSFYGSGISRFVKDSNIEEIVNYWVNEFRNGIDGTNIKPGFIKIALNDGKISPLQEKILRAACRTSIITNMTIQCHILFSETVMEAVDILIDEKLNFNKFIWAHADHECNIPVMIELGKKGMWIEIDSIGSLPYIEHINVIKELVQNSLVDRILISQDTGWYNITEDNGGVINPYHRLFTEFLELSKKEGISEIEQIINVNPMNCLNLD